MMRDTSGVRAIVFCIAFVAIVAGSFARLERLDHNLFWQDEAFSMLRITGHSQAALYGLFDGRAHASHELLALQQLDPRFGLARTIASLREEPQRGPLFYAVARLWAGFFGDGVARMRALPAGLGVLGIAFAFSLGRRFGGGATGGAILAALVAVAPVEFHFGRQVREYVALADAILASSWLLLRALDGASPRITAWLAYAASAVLGLFVSPLFVAIVLAHASVAVVAARTGARAAFARWCAATFVACAIAAPWYVASARAARAHAGDLGWLAGSYSARSLALKWLFNCGSVFFDAEFAHVRYGVVLLPIVALVACAAAIAVRSGGDPLARTLAVATTLCTSVPLVCIDLVRHTHAESVTRYQMATWIGLDLLVACALARTLASPARGVRYAATGAFAFLVACGVFCIAFDRKYAVWWDDNEHLDERSVASVIAGGPPRPLVIATKDADAAPYALVLARYLPENTAMLLYGGTLPPVPAGYRAAYLFVPSARVVAEARGSVAPPASVANVSPPLDLAIPDLRSQSASAVAATNALWRIGDARR